MSERKVQSHNTPPSPVKVLTPRAIMIGGLILVLATGGAVALLLVVGLSSNQLDAIRTGGTLVIGAGGAVALLLAARRQRSTELELAQKVEAAADARTDATERRTTELYTKASDQLGSDKAPVRLAGLYALERLAQDTPHLRQTIVNVICAYLRMPYLWSEKTASVARPLGLRRQVRPGGPLPSRLRPHVASQPDAVLSNQQEREVRLAAQAILTSHLRPSPDLDDAVGKFWCDIDLDLTGATLIDLNLNMCQIRRGRFRRAQFIGDAWFNGARFAWFESGQFNGHVMFNNASVTAYAGFEGVQFSRDAWFEGAQFSGEAGFNGAQFMGAASFKGTQFTSKTTFKHAEFKQGIPPELTRFVADINSLDLAAVDTEPDRPVASA